MYWAIEGGREERERESEIVSWIWNSFSFSVSHWRLLTPSRHRESHQCEVSQGTGHRAWEFLGCGSHGQRPTDGAHWDLGQEFRLDILWMSFILWNRFDFLMPSHCLCPAGFALEAAWRHPQRAKLVDLNTAVIYIYIYIYICVCVLYMHIQCKYKYLSIYIHIYIYLLYIYIFIIYIYISVCAWVCVWKSMFILHCAIFFLCFACATVFVTWGTLWVSLILSQYPIKCDRN